MMNSLLVNASFSWLLLVHSVTLPFGDAGLGPVANQLALLIITVLETKTTY